MLPHVLPPGWCPLLSVFAAHCPKEKKNVNFIVQQAPCGQPTLFRRSPLLHSSAPLGSPLPAGMLTTKDAVPKNTLSITDLPTDSPYRQLLEGLDELLLLCSRPGTVHGAYFQPLADEVADVQKLRSMAWNSSIHSRVISFKISLNPEAVLCHALRGHQKDWA